MTLRPGDRFGRYELAELLGKGGMGEVHRARDTVLHRQVALKILKPPDEAAGSAASGAGGGAARMLREARAAARLVHPNAIAIYDVGELHGAPFLAMELVEGRTLRAFVNDAAVPVARKIRWLTDVARALAAAHELGIVHRDIKPENVMVRADGVVKVLDFGIARRVTLDATNPLAATLGTLTADGLVVGTPVYMAPEQMRGESLDGRTDQFAWGVVACELLTGVVPWRAESDVQLVAQILSSRAPSLRERNAEIPPEVDAAVRTALGKEPADRYATMDDLADVIEPFATSDGATTNRSAPKRIVAAVGVRTAQDSREPVREESPLGSRSEPVMVPASTKRRGRTGRSIVVALSLSVLAASAMFRTLPTEPAKAPMPDASAAPETQSQMSSSSVATAEYLSGMRALRDGTALPAKEHFDRALETDPAFAAAHLGRGMFETLSGVPNMTDLQKHLAGARSGRGSLGTRDQALLDALEPCAAAPPDFRETARRLADAAKRFPDDADLPFEEGFFLRMVGDHAGAVKAFEECLARDPRYATAWWMIARDRVAQGDEPGAIEANEQCLKAAPEAMACIANLAQFRSRDGKCDDVVSLARRMAAVMPDSDDAYQTLANGLYGTGGALGAVRSALELRWKRAPPRDQRRYQIEDLAIVDVLAGKFDSALVHCGELESELATSPDEAYHFIGAYARMLIDYEIGRSADVASVARDYMQRRSAWSSSKFEPALGMQVAVLDYVAGGMSREELDALRNGWPKEHGGTDSELGAGYVWTYAYAGAVRTPADAAFALSKMPPVRPLLASMEMTPELGARIAHAYLLGGRIDEALPLLRTVTSSCAAVRRFRPIYTTWAYYDLGQALEAKEDGAGACEAYSHVLGRWGDAPESRTAAASRSRVRALGCGGRK